MQLQSLFTTPFGRRALSLGMLSSQVGAQELQPDASVDKWKLFRNLCEARAGLGISDRTLVVLNALLTFYPETELSEERGLVVFPSNAQLSLRAHGMAPATLRRHLAALVEAGLIIRKDSPNGKRYARKGGAGKSGAGLSGAGELTDAFGFIIAPLIARAAEFEAMADSVRFERRKLKLMKERVSLLRRDIEKLIELGVEQLPHIDWQDKHSLFRSVIDGIPRQAGCNDLEPALDGLECIHLEVSTLLESKILLERKIKTDNLSAKESQNERHKQNSNTDCDSDLELRLRSRKCEACVDINASAALEPTKGAAQVASAAKTATVMRRVDEGAGEGGGQLEKPVPLGLVLKACPDIADYAKNGIGNWRDLMATAVLVRSMLGVSPSAYENACEILGQERAAIVIACILQRAAHINSAGGYLRSLTDKAKNDGFSIWPMLLSQLRTNGTVIAAVE